MKVVMKALGVMDDHLTMPMPRLSPEQADRLVAANLAAGVQLPARV